MLHNPHVVHGMVNAGLPNAAPDERTLWRWDTQPTVSQPHTTRDRPTSHLLILTESKPDWTHIVEQAGWPNADGDHCMIRDYTPVFTHLAIGREFAFRLTAHPIQNATSPVKPTATQQRLRDTGPRRGFRISHRTTGHQLNWLLSRTAKWGFHIPSGRIDTPAPGFDDQAPPAPDVRITAREQRRFRKNNHAPSVVITAVTFEGRLAVTDPALLRHALLAGVGPSKAYGCGLLTLAPLPGDRRG